MNEQEIYHAIALSRLPGISQPAALHLYKTLGSAEAVYAHRHDVAQLVPGCNERLCHALTNWEQALSRAAQEMAFVQKHGVKVLCYGSPDYPQRLKECPDVPLVLYYMGTANLNQQHVVAIVGTRQATQYGQDLVRHFVADLHALCPQVLIVSGLAYGIDIHAHREALQCGYETVGVVAHGLNEIYPSRHRDTAKAMLTQGGVLTEYMSQTPIDKMNFVRRNRIVAGLSEATIVVESAAKGGALITAHIAQDYQRSVFAFPGPVGANYSEGCNSLIRDNVAALITSAHDFVDFMGWPTAGQLRHAKAAGIERQLFPDLSSEEQAIVDALQRQGDLQLSMLSVQSNIAIGQLSALLFQLELKGVVRPLAGGNYHLLL